jgi:hypothetical protein
MVGAHKSTCGAMAGPDVGLRWANTAVHADLYLVNTSLPVMRGVKSVALRNQMISCVGAGAG